MDQPQTSQAIPKRSFKAVIARHTALAITAAALSVCLVAGGIAGGVAIAHRVTHDAAAAAAAEALGLVQSAEDLLTSSRGELEDAAGSAISYRDAAAAAAKDAGPYLGAPATAELTKAIDALKDTLDMTVTENSTSEAVTLRAGYAATPAGDDQLSTGEPDQLSTGELEQLRAEREAEAARIASKATAMSDLALDLAKAKGGVDEALQAIAAGAAKVAEQLGTSYPSATQAAKDALAAALNALSTQGDFADADSLAVVTAYIGAAKGVEVSHVAEEARKAQEAAGAASGGSSGGSGGGDGGGYYGGPVTGGSGGDGGSGGGGTVDNNRYVQTNGYYVPMSSCTWATDDGTHDPGPGGTSVVSSTYPWSYVNMGTYIQFYRC